MAVDATHRQIRAHDLSGRCVEPERLHVTLHWLGDHDGVPNDLIRRARRACSDVEMAPFGVCFDRIGSLGGAEMGGLVLTGSAGLKTLRQFQHVLAREMDAAGIGHCIRKRFNPHVSLFYGRQHVARETVAPIRWTVDELVLVDSLVGDGVHVDLDNWPLQSRQMSFVDW